MSASASAPAAPQSPETGTPAVAVSGLAKSYGGIYSTHIRDEGEGVFTSVAEAIAVGRGANVPVDVIHLKIAHKNLWGRMNEVVAMIQKARDEGLNIQANVYPYTAGQNNLASIVPPWAMDGGRDQMVARLKNPALRPRLRREILNGLPHWYNHYLATGDGWAGMLLVSLRTERNKPFQGKRMSELIASRGGDPADVLMDVLIEEGGSVPTVFFHHSEPDMQLAMQQPWTSIGSDGGALSVDGPTSRTHPHPRFFGTFPRVLGRYVRERSALALETAVHKMTGLGASRFGLQGRGRIAEGFAADLVVFDADTVADRATFDEPARPAVGIDRVYVNGRLACHAGRTVDRHAGRVLRRRSAA